MSKKFFNTQFSLPSHFRLAPVRDGRFASACVWPEIDRVVELKRFDIYHLKNPVSQQGTSNLIESRRIRQMADWFPESSFFFLDEPTPLTKVLSIESTGPPRRDKV